MGKARIIVVVEKNVVLSNIAIKPLVLSFEIWIRIIRSRSVGFSNTRRSIDPDSSYVWVIILLLGI